MMKKQFFLLAFLSICSLCAHSQTEVQGKVTDSETGEALIGATVTSFEFTGTGTTADIDGTFSLVVPEGTTRIVVSYTGYNTQTLELQNEPYSIRMIRGQLLEEVVVIGYGSVKREDLTGSVQSVDSEKFNKGLITGPQELLTGKIPGVSIVTDGDPGGGSTIRIRGESSLRASNDPLIVIDGVPMLNGNISGGRNPLNVINPNDIESFTVLKDASAAAIYGNRAAGGVIVITTKKGSAYDKLRIGYSGNFSVGTIGNRIDIPNADEYRQLIADQYEEGHPAFDLLGGANTDWQDEIFSSALGMDHSLNFSGGLGRIPYRLSLGYTDKDGLLRTDNFNRTTVGLNLNPKFFDNHLQVNASLKYMRTTNQFADRGAIGNALRIDPTQPILDPESPYGGFYTWTGVDGNPNNIAPTNPVALLEMRDDRSRVNRYIFNVTTDYRFHFLPDMRANLNLAIDDGNGSGTTMVPTNAAFAFDNINGGGTNNEYKQDRTSKLLEFYLNYKKSLGKNELDIMAGYSWQHFDFYSYSKNSDAAGTPAETTIQDDPAEYYLVSLFGRINYTFNDRFLATFTVRNDGTSRFSPDNRWGLFPATALAYKFIDNNNSRFNNLKLRAGWGITGQEDITDLYAYLARYQLSLPNAQYLFGNTFINTLRPNGYDANIQWEETETFNFGLDVSIIRDRFSANIDYYRRNTSNLLNRIPVPAGTNLTNFVTTNVGNMKNQGIELNLDFTALDTESITWSFNVNFARNVNEITRLTATEDPTYQGIQVGGIAGGVGSNIQIHTVGYAPYTFYVYEQMYDDDGKIIEGEFADRNGDGEFNANDFYRYKNRAPDYTIGFSSYLKIGNLDFSFAGRRVSGNYVYNNVQTDMGYLARLYGTNGYLANINRSAITNNIQDQASVTFSDHFVEDASFLRIDYLSLGYSLENIHKNPIRLSFTVQNPVVISSYSGIDPEISSGIDNNIYPRATTYVFGISTDF